MLNKAMSKGTDPHLQKIIQFLRDNRCHSAILYGSRARGEAGAVSDYDVVGVMKRGSKTRVAKKVDGVYWDLFIYPEKDLKKLGAQQLGWRDAKVLFEESGYGRRLVARIQKAASRPFKPEPQYELDVTRAWAEKQLERIAQKDVQGFYRRAEFQIAALEHYFQLNRMQYWGPKAGLQWLKQNDAKTYKLFAEVYKKSADMKALKALVKRVYQVN